jgi:tetratricopeptide (TPR) repeat protein
MEVAGASLALLQALLGKSLIHLRTEATGARYDLNDLLRHYAYEQLQAAGEENAIRQAHLQYMLRLVDAADAELRGARQSLALQQLEAEHDNLRAALEWSLSAGDRGAGLRLAGALGPFWVIRGHWREGRASLEHALEACPEAPAEDTARALQHIGTLAQLQGDYATAEQRLGQSLALFRDCGDRRGEAQTLSVLGTIAETRGDDRLAEKLHSESVRLFRDAGDDHGIAEALSDLGDIVRRRGDDAQAEALYRESLARAQHLGDQARIAASLHDLAVIARSRGDYNGAVALIEESLALNRQLHSTLGIVGAQLLLGDVLRLQGDLQGAMALHETSFRMARELGSRWGIAWALSSMAQVAQAQGDPARALVLYEQSLALEQESHNQQRIDEILAAIDDLRR